MPNWSVSLSPDMKLMLSPLPTGRTKAVTKRGKVKKLVPKFMNSKGEWQPFPKEWLEEAPKWNEDIPNKRNPQLVRNIEIMLRGRTLHPDDVKALLELVGEAMSDQDFAYWRLRLSGQRMTVAELETQPDYKRKFRVVK